MKDETLLYDFSSYECTDSDCLQFCKKEGQRIWWYFQIIDDELIEKYDGDKEGFISAYNSNEHINGRSIRQAVNSISAVAATIDLDDCIDDDIERCLHHFGYSMTGDCRFVDIKEEFEDDWEQLCCEFLFEEMIPELLENEQIALLRF